jgi:hypothetical protein
VGTAADGVALPGDVHAATIIVHSMHGPIRADDDGRPVALGVCVDLSVEV